MFITFEGPEGAGKTTILARIATRLKELGEVLVTREPGGIKIAEKIRAVILDPEHVEMDERTEALLYAAARSQHYFERVAPALQQHKIVLCDRFIDSSFPLFCSSDESGNFRFPRESPVLHPVPSLSGESDPFTRRNLPLSAD